MRDVERCLKQLKGDQANHQDALTLLCGMVSWLWCLFSSVSRTMCAFVFVCVIVSLPFSLALAFQLLLTSSNVFCSTCTCVNKIRLVQTS